MQIQVYKKKIHNSPLTYLRGRVQHLTFIIIFVFFRFSLQGPPLHKHYLLLFSDVEIQMMGILLLMLPGFLVELALLQQSKLMLFS